MLDKILFWVVLAWMITLLVMAIIAVREIWKEDSCESDDSDDDAPPGSSARETAKSNSPGPDQ